MTTSWKDKRANRLDHLDRMERDLLASAVAGDPDSIEPILRVRQLRTDALSRRPQEWEAYQESADDT